MRETKPKSHPIMPSLRRPYAHILILWLGPLLAWLALWQLLWHGSQSSLWKYGCAMLFGGWWMGMCAFLLGPPDAGTYLGDRGRLWAGPLYSLLSPLPRLSLWLGIPGLLLCWWQGLALGVLGLLGLMACMAWLPLSVQRVWIGDAGIWGMGRDIRYIAYQDVRNHGWLDPQHLQWIGERDTGWPVQINFPHSDASAAFEEMFLHAQQAPDAGDVDDAVEADLSDSHPQDASTGPPQDPDDNAHQSNGPPQTSPPLEATTTDAAPSLEALSFDSTDEHDILWPSASRGRWRWILAVALMAAWVGWWLWACWGQDVRIARPFSFVSFLALASGLLVCLQWSRWPPTWLTGWLVGRGNCLWRSDDRASRLFRWLVVPCGLLVCGVSALSLHLQLWKLPALYVSPWGLVGDLLQMSLGLLVLADPTGAVSWRCHTPKGDLLRRYGWIEQLPRGSHNP